MSKQTDDVPESEVPEKVAIEGMLPLKAIGIESVKDMKPGRTAHLRFLHKWFAARPTPAARLAVLASVYPGEISSDELLKLMQIGPASLDSDIAEHVIERNENESERSGSLDDHYGYPNPNRQKPTEKQVEELHKTVKDSWGGELPTVLDATAGRGTIPFESLRYGFPTLANELNPIPYLILKTALEFAPKVGSLREELEEYRDKINKTARENLEEYYPTEEDGREILNSVCTYVINCDSCGGEIPLVLKWWIHKKSSTEGHAIRPVYTDGEVSYKHVKLPEEITTEEFDPSDAPVKRGSAECPHCSVVTESEDVKSKLADEEFEYSIYGVNYEDVHGNWNYRAGSDTDKTGMERAAERIESDFDLLTFLTEPIEVSSRINDPTNYGMSEWRDIFTPRQLVAHYEYVQAFHEVADEVTEEYNHDKSDAMLTVLSLVASKTLDHNSRLAAWKTNRGNPNQIFKDNNFSLKKMFSDNNLFADRRGYEAHSERIIDAYEELCSYVRDRGPADVACGDAASLPDRWNQASVDVAVVDPPYYDSIMYAELSDIFYVIQKEYHKEINSELFDRELSNKTDEAVANPARFDDVARDDMNEQELATKKYEDKMQEIFDELHDVIVPGGVVTIMFTHKEMDAWDTLTTSLIESGFVVTSTHPITSEMPGRVGMVGKSSADSSILLVGRKQPNIREQNTLWSDVKSETRAAASREARNLLNSGVNLTKTDAIVAAYGPTLETYSKNHPIVDKKGDLIKPRQALKEARDAVTEELAEMYLETEHFDELDSLTRWYVLSWLVYESDTFPYDEGRQLGMGVGVDIDEIKRNTKIWKKSSGDIKLENHSGRVQDIVKIRSDNADNPSARKYPVNPTDNRFTYTIDIIHAALHVYEREGADYAWNWLSERNLKSNNSFEVALTALLEVLPEGSKMYETLVNLVSGETGDYLDIDLGHVDITSSSKQTSLGDHTE